MGYFKDKVVVVTGAGGGLGKAHAIEFARRSARLVVNDLGSAGDGTGKSDMADSVVDEIRALGGEAIVNNASVADKEGAQSIIDDAINAFGTVDILVNTLAPAAETRLIGTIPGVEVNLEDPDPMRHPKLVSPTVLLLCDNDAPTNKTIHAGNGHFSCSATFVNQSLEFDADVTYEDLLARKDELLDMSNVEEMSGLIRALRMREQQK